MQKEISKLFSRINPLYGLKVISLSALGVFLMVAIPKLGMSHHLFSPNVKRVDALSLVTPKLGAIPNTFKVLEPLSVIPQTLAASDFDGASSYVVIDFGSGKVLLSKDPDKRVPIASLTKLMSSVVALDISSPNEVFQVSNAAAGIDPTRIGVIPGQKMNLQELLEGSLLTSANDAMEVIREGIDEDYADNSLFVRAMNQKAIDLGLQNSHFTNPQGFDDPSHYSSAADLAILAHYALINYPLIASIVQKDYVFLPASENHKQFDLYNWNGLLDVYPGIEGVKIGNTDNAGYTDIVLSQRDGKKVLTVLLGAPGVLQRDQWASELLDSGFKKLGESSVGVTRVQLMAKYATWKYWN